ncbi:MAG: methyltransferase [Dysgonamonadaceae bacterium]|jgi:tRNA1Val (adenine37-N6)-methyltransferase|nr:methyltransferase [Dysgonamonadaceae bacterium]
MSQAYFQFKQFTVRHDLCAMKVGTDGAVLGAWADCSRAQSALDVGAGSGLIALMLAQRSNAAVDAVDIDENACRQSKINFENSPFGGRMRIFNADYRNFQPGRKYDLIVSNPPYFSRSLKPPLAERSFARHDEALPTEILISKSASLMNENSRLSLIIPTDKMENTAQTAEKYGLHLRRKTEVYSLPTKPPKRVLLEFTNCKADLEEDKLTIETSPKIYSSEFVRLLKEFYLKL